LKPAFLIKGGEKRYPVYTRVIFDSDSTQFSNSFSFALHGLTKEEFNDIFIEKKRTEFLNEIENFDKTLRKIIRFEKEILKDKFTLKGISKRFTAYHYGLLSMLEKNCIFKLKEIVNDYIKNDNQSEMEVNMLLSAMDDFFEVAYLMAEQTVPNLREKLPKALEVLFTSFMHLRTAKIKLESMDKDNEYLKVLDWLELEPKRQFKEYLLSPKDEADFFKNEAKHSPFILTWRKFPIQGNLILNYVAIIDNAIVENLM
jgi:hypothetical protein